MTTDFKNTKAATTTITRDLDKLEIGTNNIYETLVIVAKRANQINAELKEELTQKLEEFASYNDNLEEIFENREQIEISKYYERLPKPTLLALEEFIENQIYFRNPSKEEEDDDE